MANTPILNLPQVAPNQNQKEATINTAMGILEAACNDELGVSMAGGNRTLNTTEFTRAFHLQFSAQTAARVVTIPATDRFFAASNNGTFNLTLKTPSASAATVILEPGKRVLVISDGVNVVAISAGVSTLANLSDVVGASDASAGQLMAYDASGETWGPIDNFCDFSVFKPGQPSAAEPLFRQKMTRSVRLLSDFSGSQGDVTVPATAGAAAFQVFKNATIVGTISFATGSATPTFSTDTGSGSSSITLAPGDILTIEAPASADPDLADIAITLKGVYL